MNKNFLMFSKLTQLLFLCQILRSLGAFKQNMTCYLAVVVYLYIEIFHTKELLTVIFIINYLSQKCDIDDKNIYYFKSYF